jgi:hypothetical protein
LLSNGPVAGFIFGRYGPSYKLSTTPIVLGLMYRELFVMYNKMHMAMITIMAVAAAKTP